MKIKIEFSTTGLCYLGYVIDDSVAGRDRIILARDTAGERVPYSNLARELLKKQLTRLANAIKNAHATEETEEFEV